LRCLLQLLTWFFCRLPPRQVKRLFTKLAIFFPPPLCPPQLASPNPHPKSLSRFPILPARERSHFYFSPPTITLRPRLVLRFFFSITVSPLLDGPSCSPSSSAGQLFSHLPCQFFLLKSSPLLPQAPPLFPPFLYENAAPPLCPLNFEIGSGFVLIVYRLPHTERQSIFTSLFPLPFPLFISFGSSSTGVVRRGPRFFEAFDPFLLFFFGFFRRGDGNSGLRRFFPRSFADLSLCSVIQPSPVSLLSPRRAAFCVAR